MDRKDGKYMLHDFTSGEYIEVPAENIVWIATANLGSSYGDTSELDPALMRRFSFTVFVDYDSQKELEILKEIVDEETAKRMVEFAKKVRENYLAGRLPYPLDTGTLVEWAELIRETEDPIEAAEMTFLYRIVERDSFGYPEKGQLEVLSLRLSSEGGIHEEMDCFSLRNSRRCGWILCPPGLFPCGSASVGLGKLAGGEKVAKEVSVMKIYVPERIWEIDEGFLGIVGRWDWIGTDGKHYPLYRTGYLAIAKWRTAFDLPKKEIQKLNVHGGITFDKVIEEATGEEEFLQRVNFLSAFGGYRVIGFDCAHLGDAYITDNEILRQVGFRPILSTGIVWTHESVKMEIRELYTQINRAVRR